MAALPFAGVSLGARHARLELPRASRPPLLPLRMESDLVDKLDEAWRRQGLASRMDLFRRALQAFLVSAGENDVAALLATEA